MPSPALTLDALPAEENSSKRTAIRPPLQIPSAVSSFADISRVSEEGMTVLSPPLLSAFSPILDPATKKILYAGPTRGSDDRGRSTDNRESNRTFANPARGRRGEAVPTPMRRTTLEPMKHSGYGKFVFTAANFKSIILEMQALTQTRSVAIATSAMIQLESLPPRWFLWGNTLLIKYLS